VALGRCSCRPLRRAPARCSNTQHAQHAVPGLPACLHRCSTSSAGSATALR
jgi:hypothetical protein